MTDSTTTPVSIGPAGAEDFGAVTALLTANALPVADLHPPLADFLLAREGGRVIGTIGLERYGAAGLLRSLAVDPDRRSHGIGGRLVTALEAHAAATGIGTLYLLTTTAADYFARRRYEVIGRDLAPEAVRRSAEFAALCPASAVCLRRALG
ncbi:MAG: arsenic resistance N-acetyltransferase ArsN2 [Gemmatimonadales bacterium]